MTTEFAYVIELKATEFVTGARKTKNTFTITTCADTFSAKRFKNKADAAGFIKKYDLHHVYNHFTTTLVKKQGEVWIRA